MAQVARDDPLAKNTHENLAPVSPTVQRDHRATSLGTLVNQDFRVQAVQGFRRRSINLNKTYVGTTKYIRLF